MSHKLDRQGREPPLHMMGVHRSTVLLILALAAVATLAALVLESTAPSPLSFDLVMYRVILVSLLGLALLLVVNPRSYAFVSASVLLGFTAYFLAKLSYLLFFLSTTDDVAAGLSGTFFWTPAVFMFTFLTTNLRLGRMVNMVFIALMVLLSGIYAATSEFERDGQTLNALVQLNLANLTCLVLAGIVYHFAGRHATTLERARVYQQLAHTDALTGLPNRRWFEQELARRMDAASSDDPPVPFCVLYIDLDGFKQVNDTYGHEMGDQVLRLVGQRLTSMLRGGEVVARLGGDEFAAVMDLPRTDMIATIQKRVTRAVSEPMTWAGQELSVTASVGTSNYPEHGTTVELLLHHADTAMYQRKGKPRPDNESN
ncbi:GGDEF domain-containing protein [Deinococcus sp. QL22]|uniref:GGDEF domain-containing protein n=1 Tax=Deinococcus sp. QL22 TaxID=2939437 RepID=UPI002017D427|nr:GGDEF domain-containing protein [Deinococcus sp. QL22]UQN08407.1 GGDEF domain-containing protein [Deinococcus sp. QL22]